MTKIATVYKGRTEELNIRFSRVWCMPTPWTFTMRPVAELLSRYVQGGWMWIDPFAGYHSPAKLTNDIDPETPAEFHMEALQFVKAMNRSVTSIDTQYAGVLFDPPYSYRQISEHYKAIGRRATKLDTSIAFYEKVKSAICDKIRPGGYAISFGWNSNGFGKARGFRIVEIMMIAHGGNKNDTIVTVEIKK